MSPESTRLFLVRHGEVDAAWRERIYGCLDVPLSAGGQQQASRVARILEGIQLRAVISSGLARTEHAAARLREARGLERIDEPALREIERGDWAGLTRTELEERSPGAWAAWFNAPDVSRPPRGESLEDLFRRVRPCIERWSRAHPGGPIALVTHGWVMRVLVCHALGADLRLAPRLDVRTGDITLLRWPLESGSDAITLEGFALDERLQLSE